jgi:RNA-directed DNA polymerase
VQAFLYGGLTEEKLRQFISERIASLNFRGVMSYYPVVTDIAQLANLEGWIEYVLRQALKLRQRLWYAHDGILLPGPFADWIEKVGELRSVDVDGKPVNVTLPSLRLINRAIRLAIAKKGISAVANPASRYYA